MHPKTLSELKKTAPALLSDAILAGCAKTKPCRGQYMAMRPKPSDCRCGALHGVEAQEATYACVIGAAVVGAGITGKYAIDAIDDLMRLYPALGAPPDPAIGFRVQRGAENIMLALQSEETLKGVLNNRFEYARMSREAIAAKLARAGY